MKKKLIDEYFRVFLPVASGNHVRTGDYFIISDVKHPEYEVVYECTHINTENRICNQSYAYGFHCLTVEKVELFECSTEVKIGEEVIVKYNIRFPGMITRRFFEAIVLGDHKKDWLVVDTMGYKCYAPKKYTFKIIRQLDFKTQGYDNSIKSRRLRTRAPS